jgi:divalent metal cation (Fe/Co/Zn/Cd) transporter
VLHGLRKSHNMVLLGVLLENGVDSLGVILAFTGFGLFALTGNPLWDALFSLAIAATLATSSIFLLIRNGSLLIGEAVDRQETEKIARVISGHPAVTELTSIYALVMSPGEFRCHAHLRLDYRRLEERVTRDHRPLDIRVVRRTVKTLTELRREIGEEIRRACPEVKSIHLSFDP